MKRAPLITPKALPNGTAIKAVDFQVVNFLDTLQGREVILIYCLDEHGVIREFANGKWTPLPIFSP